MYKDLVTSHLKEDPRIQASMLCVRRIYASLLYEVFICIYSGLLDSKSLHDDLVTCLVVFRKEKIRVMYKLCAAEIRGDRPLFIEETVKRIEQQGRGPLHLVRDAKQWTGIPWTEEDRRVFRQAGLEPLP